MSLLILDSRSTDVINVVKEQIKKEHEIIEKAQKTLDAAKAFLADVNANENDLASETPKVSTGKMNNDMQCESKKRPLF